MTKIAKSRAPKGLRVVGHRGARGLAPENTVKAIQKALEHGVDEIEIDIRITKDGIPVVHHNMDLKDASGARLPVRHHTLADLKQHNRDLATLEEAIEAVGRKVPLQMEVKWGERTRPVIDVLQTYLTKGWHETDFLIGSKKQKTLMELHRALPAVPTVVIEPFSGVRASIRARQLGTKRLSMNHLWLWSGFIRSMSKRDYQVYAYTLNRPARLRKLARHGLAGVVTDYPNDYDPVVSGSGKSKRK